MQNLNSFSLFVFFFALAYERIFIKMHNIKIRFVLGLEYMLLAGGCVQFSAQKFYSLRQWRGEFRRKQTQNADFTGWRSIRVRRQAENSHSAPLFQALSVSQLPEILKFTEAYLCSSPLEAWSQTLSANPSHYLHNTENWKDNASPQHTVPRVQCDLMRVGAGSTLCFKYGLVVCS